MASRSIFGDLLISPEERKTTRREDVLARKLLFITHDSDDPVVIAGVNINVKHLKSMASRSWDGIKELIYKDLAERRIKGIKKAKCKFVVVRFPGLVFSTRQILDGMKRRKLKPATAIDLIEFVRKFPKVSKFFGVVALGTTVEYSVKGYRFESVLARTQRFFSEEPYKNVRWGGDWIFLCRYQT